MSAMIAISVDDVVDVHVATRGEYATICGMDGDDSAVGIKPASLPKEAKITCAACFRIWDVCVDVKIADFEVKARR